MTTREFIERTYNTKNERWGRNGYDRWCSSVVTDKDGIVYSYGRHYPLAFHLAGLDFVNIAGYSNTTAKHISWAWQAVGYNAIGVKLYRTESETISSSAYSTSKKLEAVSNALARELEQVNKELDSKKRKDTQVYALLFTRKRQLEEAGARVAETLRVVKHLEAVR